MLQTKFIPKNRKEYFKFIIKIILYVNNMSNYMHQSKNNKENNI